MIKEDPCYAIPSAKKQEGQVALLPDMLRSGLGGGLG